MPLFDALRLHARSARPGHNPVRVTIEYEDGVTEPLAVPPSHSPDFRSVVWQGRCHLFTPNQAAVVRILWAAWELGTSEISQEYLTVESGIRSNRLANLFRDHPAWGTMIRPGEGSKGTFRLCDEKSSK